MFYEDLYLAKDVYQNIKEGVSGVEENSSGEMKKREKKNKQTRKLYRAMMMGAVY